MNQFVLSAGRRILSYLYDDVTKAYGLAEAASCTLSGPGIGIGSATAGPLTIESEPGGEQVTLRCKPFSARTCWWNGPNIIPDGLRDGSFEASLWHDLLWEFCDEFCLALGMRDKDFLRWADGIFAAAYKGYAAKKYGKERGAFARLAYNVVRAGAAIKVRARRLKKWFLNGLCIAVATVFFSGCSGCAAPPDWVLEDAGEINYMPGGEACDGR